MNVMISVQEAKNLVAMHCSPLPPVKVPLENALAKVLAEDIRADQDIPGFSQSAMDGYAFRLEDFKRAHKLKIKGESPAGLSENFELGSSQAARIFTGAPLPAGADTVVIQENVLIREDQLMINDPLLRSGSNVRPAGSEIKVGSLAMQKGSVLMPAAIGFLAGIGTRYLIAYPSPVINIIITGNELQMPGTSLLFGHVYESNSFILSAALQQMHLSAAGVTRMEDKYESMQRAIPELLDKSDVLLITGGVSEGDYDYTAKALKACEVEQVFHKVRQKPGKPLFFGRKTNKLVFGLPGNPSSVLTCFYEYVYPALRQMMGFKNIYLSNSLLKMSRDYRKKAGLTHFVKAFCHDREVEALPAQESYRMQSFAVSNCLICLDEHIEFCQKDETVQVHLLPV